MSLDGSGNELASQRLLQSYMDNLFPAQPNNNLTDGSNINVGPQFNTVGQKHLQHAPAQQALHPGVSGVPAFSQQNQPRYQLQSNSQANSQQQYQPQQHASFQQQQQLQQAMWPNQSGQAAPQQQQPPQRQPFPQNQQQHPQPQQQQQQLSQAEIQAMFASLGANQPQSTSLSLLPSQQQQQQPGQPQAQTQAFQPNAIYNSQLQAAFQQLQQSQSQSQTATPTPPNGFSLQQQQQPQQQQFGGLSGHDVNLLLKLRQSGMQLTPEQQAYFGRAMLRRGALAEGQSGQPQSLQPQPQQSQGQASQQSINNHQQLHQQQQQSLQMQQSFRQPNQLPTSSLPLGLSNMQLAHPQSQTQLPSQQQQQQQQQQQHAPLFPVHQPQQANFNNQAGPIPVNVLQEFTSLSEQLRNFGNQEQHLAVCLAQNLNIPLQKATPGQQVIPPQPLNQGQRTAIEKQCDTIRRMLQAARETLARLEGEHGGKENIIVHLKTFAQQRQAAQQHMQAQAQAHAQSQNQSQMQQQQQQQQLGVMINRGQMRTPVNGGPLQNQGQSTPSQSQRSINVQGQGQGQGQGQSAMASQIQPQATPQQAHAQAQLQRAMAMQLQQQQQQQQQQQNQPQPQPMGMNTNQGSSPQSALRNLSAPSADPSIPSVGALGLMPQGQHQPQAQLPLPIPQGQQSQAQQQFLRNQAVAVNEEILKTLNVAGPSAFRKALFDTMRKRGTPISTTPRVDGKEIDLVKLYTVVQQRGGCVPIRQQGLWRQVALDVEIRVDAESATRVSQSLSQVYSEFLEPFEDIQRKAAMANYQKHQMQAVANMSRQQQQQQPSQQQQPPTAQQQQLAQGIPRQSSPSQQAVSQNQATFQLQQQQHTQNHQQYLQNMQHLQQQAQQQHAANLQQQAQANMQQQQQFQQPQHTQVQAQVQAQPQAIPPSPHVPSQQQQQLQSQQHNMPLSHVVQTQSQGQSQPAQASHQRMPSQTQGLPLQQQEGTPVVPASTLPRQPSQLSQAQQPVSLPIAQQQLPATRPPGLPTQEEINRAKNEIEQMKTSLLNNQPHYERLNGIEPGEQEIFTAAVRSLAPMVDKIIERLPLYLAISRQPEGTRRLLIMMFMFKDQLLLLDRKEFILRLSDLGKLRVQMQRCWSYISVSATGHASPHVQPLVELPANISNVPAPPASGLQQAGQVVNPGIGIEVAGFPASVLKAGLRMEDLKPPFPKHRRTESSAGTPTAGISPPAGPPSVPNTGTGATYASPIALDSPSPAKGSDMKTDPKPNPAVAAAIKKSSNTGTPPTATIAKGASKAKAKAKQAVAPTTDISVPALAMGAYTFAAQPGPEALQYMADQQLATLKRKRELEEAELDPAGFTERIFASYLSTGPIQPGEPTASAAAVSDSLSSELLSFLNHDILQDDEPSQLLSLEMQQNNPAGKADGGELAINFFLDDSSTSPASQSVRWFSDNVSTAAETPELAVSEDPMKTSPPDSDSVGTPSDSNPLSILQHHQKSHTHSSSTSAILSSFDQEYNQIFGSLSATTTNSATKANPDALSWSWQSGPVLATQRVT